MSTLRPSQGWFRRSRALLLEVLLLLLWLFVLGEVVQRSSTPLSSGGGEGMALLTAAGEGPGAEWVGIYLEGKKIGAGLADTIRHDHGHRVQERSWLRLRAFEQDREIITVFVANTDLEHRLRDFSFLLLADPSRVDVRGQVRGATLELEIHSAGEIRHESIPLKEVPEVSLTFKERILRQNPAVGDVIEIPYFDPGSMSQQRMQVKVVGQGEARVDGVTVPTFTLETGFMGVTSRAVVTADGRTLEETSALGMTLKRESREQAMLSGWDEGRAAVDVISLSAVTVAAPIPNARQAVYLDAHLSGGGVEVLLARPEDGARVGDVTVRIPARESWKTYQIPMTDPRYTSYLADSPALQKDNPQIVRVAQSLIGDVTSADDAVARINAWVHERLKKVPVMSIPSSLEILRTGQGDCNEHTTLFTALARAVGIPTRMAAGVVYSEDITGSPAFYYHAWPEVFLGVWVPVDPTFGQMPADATHIKLVEGDLADQLSLLRVVGNLKIEVRESH